MDRVQRPHVILGTAAVALIGVAAWLYHEVNAGAETPVVPDVIATTTKAPVLAPPPVAEAPPKVDDTKSKSPSPWTASLKSGLAARTPHNADKGHDTGTEAAPPDPALPDKADPKWDAILAEVNKSYDRGEYEDAKQGAIKVLAKDPTNVRMLRVAVSSACMNAEPQDAQLYYDKLTDKRDREQMKTRCDRFQITLNDPK